MVRNDSDCKCIVTEGMRGGPGIVKTTHLVTAEEVFQKSRLFGSVVLEPGCGIGYHVHEGEGEIFYLLNGSAIYNDNGTEVEVKAGDVMICDDGQGHAITNNTDSAIRMIALITLK